MVLSLSLVFIPKIKAVGDVKGSVAAAYAADSAVEWCLYVNRINVASQPVTSNNATYLNGYTGLPFAAVSPNRAIAFRRLKRSALIKEQLAPSR